MNKTQLNYFEIRVNAIKGEQISKVNNAFPLMPQLNMIEQAEQIHIGNARFILWDTIQNSGGKCPYINNSLETIFHIPKMELIWQKNEGISRMKKMIFDKIERHATYITDKFVLLNKPDLPEMLIEFEQMEFITQSDKDNYILFTNMEVEHV